MVGHLVQLNSKATSDHFSQGYNGSGWLLKATYIEIGTVGIYFPTYINYGSVVYQSAVHLSHVNKKSEYRLVVRVPFWIVSQWMAAGSPKWFGRHEVAHSGVASCRFGCLLRGTRQ